MCKAQNEGGRRCPKHLMERQGDLKAKIASTEFDLKDQALSVQENNGLIDDSGENNFKALKTKLINYQAEYKQNKLYFDSSTVGMAELQSTLNDPTSTDAEKKEAQNSLDKALEFKGNLNAVNRERVTKQRALVENLTEQGVSQADIAEIMRTVKADQFNPYPRSAAYYRERVEEQKQQIQKQEARYDDEVTAIFEAKHPADEEAVLLDEADARHATKKTQIISELNRYRLAYESTTEGIREIWGFEVKPGSEAFKKLTKEQRVNLRKDDDGKFVKNVNGNYNVVGTIEQTMDKFTDKASEAYASGDKVTYLRLNNRAYDFYAKHSARKKDIEAMNKAVYSDRKNRALLKKQITDSVKKVGGNPDAALKAWRKPDARATSLLHRDERVESVKSHLTGREVSALQDSYRKTKSYKEHGDAGFKEYVAGKVLGDPFSHIPKKATVQSINEKAEIFDKGVKGRHRSSLEGKRDTFLNLTLKGGVARSIERKAASLNMSRSAYIRGMVTGKNVFVIENDRSAQNHRRKTKAVTEVLEHGFED